MWFRHLKNWVPKQDSLFPELIEYGYVSIKGVTYTSQLNRWQPISSTTVFQEVALLTRPHPWCMSDPQRSPSSTWPPQAMPSLTSKSFPSSMSSSRLRNYKRSPASSVTLSRALAQKLLLCRNMKRTAASTGSSYLLSSSLTSTSFLMEILTTPSTT